MKIEKISGLILLALLGASLNGQVRQPHSLYFMESIPQISQINPAFQPRANGYITINVNADYNNDLAVKDLLQKQGKNWYSPLEKRYDYNKLRNTIGKDATMINVGADIEFLSFGFRTGSGYFHFGLSEHFSGNFALPSDLFKITENGFPDGTKLDFSPLRTQGIAYMQLLFGYSGKISEKLSFGVNVKPLLGEVAVSSKIDKFGLNAGAQEWEIDAKGNIYSSAPVELIMKDNDKDKIADMELRDFDDYKPKDWVNNYFFKNPGIAFDLGAAYQINERFNVSASLNNLGFISWKNDLNSISFNGKYTFNGVKYDVSEDNHDEYFKSLGDSIADAVNYFVKHDKFKTPLAPALHVGTSYRLSNTASVGFLSRSVFWEKGLRQSFNTTFSLQPYSFVAMNVGATWQVKSNVCLSGGLIFLIGPLQIYALVDNVPVYYSTLTIIHDGKPVEIVKDKYEISIPERMKTATVRTGINFVFGKHGYNNKPMLDKGKSSWN